MLIHKTYSTATTSSSINWRTQIKQDQLVYQISSILLQRHNWVSLLQSFSLSSKLNPCLFLKILNKIQTHPQISLNFFNWAKSNLNFQPDLKSQCHIIQLSVQSGLVQPARTILDPLVLTQPASVLGETMIQVCRGKDSQSNALSFVLGSYSHKGLFMEGLEVFRTMRINGCNPSINTCNSLVDVLLRKNKIKLAWCCYGAMIRNGLLPDKLTWSLVAQILCKEWKFERIVKILDMGIYNPVIYNGVVDFYSKSGDFGAAFDRVNEMHDRRMDPGFSTYSSILDGACKHGNAEVIERSIATMVEKGLLPKCLLSECDSVIQQLCNLGKMNAAMMFFKRTCGENIGLQDATYRCMLKGLSKVGRVEEAIGLYHVILERGIAMNNNTYHTFVDLLCKEDQSKEGYDMLMDVMRRGFRPCTSSMSRFIASQCSKHRWRQVEELLSMVLEKGLMPDSLCFQSLVEHYCSSRQIDKAVALHNKMEKLETTLDVSTNNILLDGLVKERRIEDAVRVFDYMKGSKLVNSVSFTIIIHGLCHAKELRKAMKLHDEMLRMELKPDQATYKRLISGFKQ